MIKLAKDFLSELELNNLKKPNIINEPSTEGFIYMIWSFENKISAQIEFHLDGEIVLMRCSDNHNYGKSIKEYNFTEIKEFLRLK
jgi:hypothetical protein